jgi:hypothetical protein
MRTPTPMVIVVCLAACALPCQDDGLSQERCEATPAGTDSDGSDSRADDDDGSPGPASQASGVDDGTRGGDDGSDTDTIITAGHGGSATESDSDSDSDDDTESDSAAEASASVSDSSVIDDDSAGDGSDGGGDDDHDDDGVPNDDDNCDALANPDQGDGDGDGLGDVCDSGTACGVDMEFEPIFAPQGAVSSGTDGLCVLCDVTDEDEVVDADFSNGGTIFTPVGLEGTAYVRVDDMTNTYAGGSRVGIVVSNAQVLLDLESLAGAAITTYLDRVPVETVEIATDDLASVGLQTGDADRYLLVFDTTAPYDAVELQLGGPISGLGQLGVHAVCVDAR